MVAYYNRQEIFVIHYVPVSNMLSESHWRTNKICMAWNGS